MEISDEVTREKDLIASLLTIFANKLNGWKYKTDEPNDIFKEMHTNSLVAVFGYSDDLMEFRGAIFDEVGCIYGGGEVYLNKEGILHNLCGNECCPYFESIKSTCSVIEAFWEEEDEYRWTFKTDIPHKTFDIMDGDEKQCRGIVFSLKDV